MAAMSCEEWLIGTLRGETPDDMIEVLVSTGKDGEKLLKLRMLSWSKDLGWYIQKTICLPLTEVESLRAILRTARRTANELDGSIRQAEVIELAPLRARRLA